MEGTGESGLVETWFSRRVRRLFMAHQEVAEADCRGVVAGWTVDRAGGHGAEWFIDTVLSQAKSAALGEWHATRARPWVLRGLHIPFVGVHSRVGE